MSEKQYACGYKHCLHPDSKVSSLESVKVGNRHFHWDCAMMNQEIKECIGIYMGYKDDKSLYPIVTKIINILVFKNRIPTDFIKENLKTHSFYYQEKPVQILYGLRKVFWEKEIGGM